MFGRGKTYPLKTENFASELWNALQPFFKILIEHLERYY